MKNLNKLTNELMKLPRPNRKRVTEILKEVFKEGREYQKKIKYTYD